MRKKVKNIDGLMKHLRDTHKIKVKGSSQKRKLRNIGYYHGYKGYRYYKSPKDKLVYTDFNEILAVNDFDMALKTMFYPKIMFIETALKNYTLEIILSEVGTDSFNDIFTKVLTNYKSYPKESEKYKNALKKRLDLRNKIYSTLSRDYRNKLVIQHFYHKDANVPIWAIFEVLSLGEFGNFITCLKQPTRKLISMSLGINQAFDTNSALTGSIIYAIKDLRNAVAHNDVIFDTRFNTSKINDTLSSALHQDCKMKNINFKTVTDYVILVCFILKQMGVSKSEILGMINNYIDITENLRGKIPVKIYSKIIHTDMRNKLESIKQYIKE